MTSPSDAGLQAERTALAWTRTSLGVAANAVLLAVREIGHARLSLAVVASGLAVVVALATAGYGRWRGARLRRAPLPDPLAPAVAVPLLGASVVVLGVVATAALVV